MQGKTGVERGRVAAGVLTAAVVVALTGCNGVQLENVWRDPDYRGGALRSVLVVSQRPDPVQRRLWEDAVVAAMTKQGLRAEASYASFPDAPPTKAMLGQMLGERGLEGGLILKPLPPSQETRYVPGWSSLEPRTFYDPWADRPVTVFRERYHRGYHVTERYAREQITLWSGADGARMIWAGTAVIPSLGTPDQVRRDLASAVAPRFKKASLVAS